MPKPREKKYPCGGCIRSFDNEHWLIQHCEKQLDSMCLAWYTGIYAPHIAKTVIAIKDCCARELVSEEGSELRLAQDEVDQLEGLSS